MNINYYEIKNEGYTVQGLTIIDNNFFITAYKKNNRSRIYIYNSNGYLGKIILDNNYHVGGISFDKKNNVIFITGGKNTIVTYNYSVIKKYIKRNFILDINKHRNIITNNNLITPYKAATLYVYKGYIYIVRFDIKTIITKIKYEMTNNFINQIKCIDLGIINNSFCVQGICFYNNHLYLSSSLAKAKSVISIYDKNYNLINRKIINQKGIEGIIIKNNILYSIFEMGNQTIKLFNLEDISKVKNTAVFLKYIYSINFLIYKKYIKRKK